MWQLAEQGRPVRAYIDTSAFVHNIELAERLAPDARALVVLKANAYGHGMVELAKHCGERDFAVASSDEALVLVQAGFRNRIWVLEGPFSARCLALSDQENIVWVVHSQWQLDLISRHSRRAQSLWLKIDTGMHRVGFLPESVNASVQFCLANEQIELQGLFTHFACSDEPGNALTKEQLAQIQTLQKQLAPLNELPLCNANSAALMSFPKSHGAWVRPGIMLYGGMSLHAETRCKQRPVMHLKSAVMALREIDAGQSVGYGQTWTAPRRSIIATVAIGYADGYPRHAPNGTPVWIKAQEVPLVGRVSMDMITVDVTDLSGIQIGDEVELWGAHIPVERVAQMAQTISYEILSHVSQRVPRIYI